MVRDIRNGLFVLLIIVPWIGCVDWSTLTEAKLAQLSPSEFLNITSAELGSIPAKALRGLNETQLQNIPPTAASGFTSDQISHIRAGICGAFIDDQIANITPDAFNGFQGPCADSWPEDVFKAISEDQVRNFSNDACRVLHPSKLGFLRPDAFSGFTSGCVSEFEFCYGLNNTFFSLLPPEAITGLSYLCFQSVPNNVFSLASADQIAALPLGVCFKLYAQYVPYIPLDAVSGFTPECIAEMVVQDSCGAMNGTWLVHLSPDSVTALSSHCIALVPPGPLLDLLDGYFFKALNPLACSGWSAAQSMYFSESAASGITAECVGNFTAQGPNGTCRGLSDRFIKGLSSTSFNGFTMECVQSIAPASVKGFTEEQLQGINSIICSALSLDQVTMIPATAAPGMQGQCLEQLSGNACTGLQPEFVAKMPPATFSGFTAECVQQVRSLSFSLISASQIANISVAAFSVLSNAQIDMISNAAIQGATLEQLRNVSDSGFDGFTMAHLVIIIRKYGNELVSAWTVEQTGTAKVYEISHFKDLVYKHNFAKVTWWNEVSSNVSRATWIELALLNEDSQPRIEADTIKALAPSAIAGLRTDHILLIASMYFQAFTPSHGAWFTEDQVNVFTAAQLRNLDAKAFGAINFMVISSLRPDLISSLSVEQIQAFPVLNIEYLTCEQITNFTQDQTALFNLDQKTAFDNTKIQCKSGDLLIPMADNEPYSEATMIVLLVMAGVLVISFVTAIIVWGVKRRHAATQGAHDDISVEEERKPLVDY
jgi:hypothetical protein